MKLNENADPTASPAQTRRNFLSPGSVIGVLGGGQLGRMLSIEAARLGYRVHIFEPDAGCPAGQVSEVEINAPYSDEQALREFAQGVDVVTYEFENVPLAATEIVAAQTLVRPPGEALHICQNREREKNFLAANGIPCAPFWVVDSAETLAGALEALNGPGVLKTASFGYDGKGQLRVKSGDDASAIWSTFGADRAVLEGWIEYTHEFSIVCARGLDGEIRLFPAAENRHEHHILDISIVPARIPDAAIAEARIMVGRIAEALEIVGLITAEFFLTRAGTILVNELAPRPHNSGHFTLDACVTSQFEQQVRATCGLPLGSTDLMRPVVMLNLLGDLWENGEPDWRSLLAEPNLELHLYGKREARPGRKMGHLCVLADSVDQALARVEEIKARLST
ncbi:MAG TPA: 5-(carboxyamino)imidazole ribonucleotide synthase [Chthoniobacterales bacterium]|nr:5-(carboxyamino)imidazole ribonucleotide synthase [Chthoniobacterales bacterium]